MGDGRRAAGDGRHRGDITPRQTPNEMGDRIRPPAVIPPTSFTASSTLQWGQNMSVCTSPDTDCAKVHPPPSKAVAAGSPSPQPGLSLEAPSPADGSALQGVRTSHRRGQQLLLRTRQQHVNLSAHCYTGRQTSTSSQGRSVSSPSTATTSHFLFRSELVVHALPDWGRAPRLLLHSTTK